MTRTSTTPTLGLLIAVTLTLAACAGEADTVADEDEARDLTLPPPPGISAIEDEPEPEPERATPPPAPPPPERPEPVVAPAPEPDPEPEEPAPARLDAGTIISLRASDTLTSRHNEPGDSIRATLESPVSDVNGEIVIPAGAVFSGTIADIAPAERPGGEGRMVLIFDQVHFGGGVYTVEAGIDTVGTRMKGRGVTAGDAAKVGAGAVVGALAGRLIGGNRRGTAVGAVAGTAAGVGIAAATRDIDIILDAGAPIRLVLTVPFVVDR
ncbi:MAG: hypothetical protein V3T28_12445 [Gemmatimonadales bacterium]